MFVAAEAVQSDLCNGICARHQEKLKRCKYRIVQRQSFFRHVREHSGLVIRAIPTVRRTCNLHPGNNFYLLSLKLSTNLLHPRIDTLYPDTRRRLKTIMQEQRRKTQFTPARPTFARVRVYEDVLHKAAREIQRT